MAKHDVRIKYRTELPVRNVDVEIPVRIDGKLRGTLGLSTGTVDWRPAKHSRNLHRVSWEARADFLENEGTAHRR